MYALYLVQCADGSLYTGIARDVQRRVQEHNTSSRGAKYTKGRRPVRLVYAKKYHNRSTASRAEARMKQLSRTAKLKLIR
ncbi:MAG: GIY-YIG nuclease family protein [Patescibacteria group bacterium]